MVFATFTLSSLLVVCSLLGVRGGIYDWAARLWSRWMLAVAGARVTVEGIENANVDRPHIFISNHQSWYDVFTLAATIPGLYRFVAKKELAKIPLFGRAWLAAGHISIDRSDSQSAIRSLEAAKESMERENASVVIFPEGTRSPTGELLPFKKGAFMLALHTGVEIVPVAISGSREILGKVGWQVRSGEIILRFGEPIPTADYTESQRDELIRRVRAAIQDLLRTPGTQPKEENVGNH
jgi:1-acyl-sn-glycerol-3-phosphate acyltransferase